MQLKTHLLVAIAAAMVAPVMFTACGGPECGTGTTEQDGTCVPTAAPVTCDEDTELTDGKCVSTVDVVTCEEGTSLEDGKCVLADSGCGEGTSLQGGECVADDPDLSQACGEGTSFDSAAGACIADSTVTCGDNTVEEDGACVPDPAAVCAAGTLPNDDGECVIDAASCGANTILDPNTNTCVINDAGVFCGTNTAYDAALETCVPTDSVCDTGTTFDDATGLCLPDATCQMGDVILNGQCVSPVQEAYANADVTVDEAADRAANNDDTNLGGTATVLTIPAIGTAYRAAGQVNAPVDVDGDGAVDQDVDSYTITGTAGQAFRIAVQPVKGPSLGFVVRNDDDSYVRLSTQGLAPGAARQIVLPEDGTYTIDVTSSIAITGPAAPVGADDWNYVLSVEEIAGPAATDFDSTAAPITGDLANLSDNLFRLTNYTNGELVSFSVDNLGDNVGIAYMQVWASPTQLVETFEISEGGLVNVTLPSPDAYVFFDWGFVSGPDTSFEVSTQSITVEVEPNDDLASAQQLTLPFSVLGTGGWAANNDREFTTSNTPFDFYTFDLTQDLAANEVISLALTNTAPVDPSGAPTVTLHDSTGAPIDSADIGDVLKVPGLTAGTYYVTIAVSFVTSFDTAYLLEGKIGTIPSEDLGNIGAVAATSTALDLNDGDSRVVTFALAAGEIAEIVHNNTENEDVNLDITGPDASFSDGFFQPLGATSEERAYIYSPNGGTYTIAIDATNNITSSVVTVTTVTPTALGPKAVGDTVDAVQAGIVPREAREFFTFSLTEDATLTGALTSNAANNADLYFYDTVTGAEVARVISGKDSINVALPVGTYLLAVYADGGELDTGYNAVLTLDPAPVTLDGTVGDSCAAPIAVNMSGTYTGDLANFTATETGRPCLTNTSNNGPDVFFEVTVPDGQTLTASAGNGTDFVAYLVNTCADIATNTCIDSDDSGNPETVTVTNTTGAPANYIFSFYTYFSSGSGTFDVVIDIQ